MSVGLIGCLAIAGCEGDSGSILDPTRYPISDGTWYMHTANDSAVSATASTRFIGIVQERIVIDSSALEVRFDGSYTQQFAIRVLHNGSLDRSELVNDRGRWRAEGSTYLFTSEVRDRTFSAYLPEPTLLMTEEPIATYIGAPLTVGAYRQTPPR
jgi:hypothetical protein